MKSTLQITFWGALVMIVLSCNSKKEHRDIVIDSFGIIGDSIAALMPSILPPPVKRPDGTVRRIDPEKKYRFLFLDKVVDQGEFEVLDANDTKSKLKDEFGAAKDMGFAFSSLPDSVLSHGHYFKRVTMRKCGFMRRCYKDVTREESASFLIAFSQLYNLGLGRIGFTAYVGASYHDVIEYTVIYYQQTKEYEIRWINLH